MSLMPSRFPACDTFVIPNVRRYAFHRSASFFLRMNRLKFTPHSTSEECVKFSVVNGISTVAVQPSAPICAAEVQTPSQPESKSTAELSLCSSTMRPSICVPNGLI